MWEEILKYEGLYEYDDWNKKRNSYYNKHKKVDVVTAESYISGVDYYEGNPAEDCRLLKVKCHSMQESLLLFAKFVDGIEGAVEQYIMKMPRNKEGKLSTYSNNRQRNYSFFESNFGHYIFPPRRFTYLNFESISEDEIKVFYK